ncbi:MAG TPA: NfeD family protein [Tenuifilaceae bacterium]|jgi:membrane-bound serine protease (ClpP class)|nr:nodulation protein NfeD [Bacteroidales bacterium]HNT41030.1 NfeD family protein [Tenuifilaceae bacterium]MBP8643636.1 nodulation protein NfeD [Bacteroidales bacterium]NLI87169.1 nodulation protein NfeD [Bacteroidales bacterium]HNY09073.1 NfeD family protein [Tenuifilaceae bacterium]
MKRLKDVASRLACGIVAVFLLTIPFHLVYAGEPATNSPTVVYKIDIQENIMPAAWRHVKRGFEEAARINADIILIHLNTYGGMVDMADSIRTKILNSKIPVWVFIDNQAASAGALISIACDSIYMRKGGSIGAATVVDQSGNVVPDKFQSFMRGMMRATAEAKGKDTIVTKGDTLLKWRRDPRIAEAMVDPSIFIEGIIDSGKVLTFTADEAILHGYCEGKAETVDEVLAKAGVESYRLEEFTPTFIDRIIGFLINPVVSGILIMLIIGGIYFELQSPGIGFPLVVAVLAAILYFAPLYLEGLAQHWELALFVVGLILLFVEIFAIPGFGVTGISGIILMVVSLTLAMIDNNLFRGVGSFNVLILLKPLAIVLVAGFLGFLGGLYLSKKFLTSSMFSNLALNSSLSKEDGFVGVDKQIKTKIGLEGIAATMLRPSGKVKIGDDWFDAISEYGYINKGERVRVTRDEAGQLYVVKAE